MNDLMAFDREWFAADTAFERFAVERLGTTACDRRTPVDL